MTIRYALRLQFRPDQDPQAVARELRQLCRAGQVDEVILFIFAEELNNGHETLAEVRSWLDTIRPWKEMLKREGIEVSLNPWVTVLHCDRGRQFKPDQPWQPMVDWKGRAASAVVCPLDKGWQAYYKETLALYAAEGFRVIWLEDDTRLANHAPLDWGGCFCPLHVAEFNRRAGASATREEILARIAQPGEPHPWRQIWLDMWDETQTQWVEEFRRVVEPSGAHLGLMTSGPHMHAWEGRRWARWWKALAGDRHPVHRPHYTGYADMMGWNLTGAVAMMDMNRVVEPPGTEIGPEIETAPYGWSKSHRQTAFQMMLAQVFGAHRHNISLYDLMGNWPSEEPNHAAFLAEMKPTLNWLSDLFPDTLRSRGVGCPWGEEMVRRKQTKPGATWRDLYCHPFGWPSWLGGFGHAFQMRKDETVNALGGDLGWAFTDEEIRWLLARGLLLDGPAAKILVERGFGKWIGLSDARFITQEDVVYTAEELTDPRVTMQVGAQVKMDDRACTQRLMQGKVAPGAQAISVLRGPKQQEVGHGVIIYENDLGGRVATCPWDTIGFDGSQWNVRRAAHMARILRYLARDRSLGSVGDAPWLIPQFLSDGTRWRGVVWNAGPDETATVQMHLPDGMVGPIEATQIDAHGRRTPVTWNNGTLHLPQPLHQWECMILRDAR
ncbi:MAG: hypothetical protein IT330_03420 [Anaerolineae bacterium]|nr:hypothetical protein [Anaerolineae bacterium]